MTRPTLDDLVEEVQGIINDSVETDEDKLIKLFNKALYNLANKISIPDLRVVGAVGTVVGVNVTPLPSNFHKGLTTCYDTTNGNHITVYNSRSLIDRRLTKLDLTGKVIGVAVTGTNLYYQKQPTTIQSLSISYLSLPASIILGIPTYLPEEMVDDLFVNYACWKIWAKIEDALEGPKANTDYYKAEYKETFKDVKEFFGPEEDEPYIPLGESPFPGSFNFNSLM